jgi:hypothetical protein
MVAANKRRAHGETGAVEEAKEASEAMTQEVEQQLPEERARHWRTPGFSRMRYSWSDSEDRAVIDRAKVEVDRVITNAFSDAYAIVSRVYDIVREPEMVDGKPVLDGDGLIVWKRAHDGWFIEDFTKLTHRQREDFLLSITTALFMWEQRASDMWGEAMFSKAQFEERFASAYDDPGVMSGRDTVEARTARANMGAAEDRYFAIFLSLLSKRADSVVRSMDRLALRLRDSMAK